MPTVPKRVSFLYHDHKNPSIENDRLKGDPGELLPGPRRLVQALRISGMQDPSRRPPRCLTITGHAAGSGTMISATDYPELQGLGKSVIIARLETSSSGRYWGFPIY